jgi:hypothetical protein
MAGGGSLAEDYPVVQVTSRNACWVFVSGSNEARHLHDIVFAVHALRKKGVPDKNILVFTDHPIPAQFLAPFGINNIHRPETLESEISKCSGFRCLMLVVTGHGVSDGIPVAGSGNISPTALLKAARSCPGIQTAALILCQCFAGVFRYLDVRESPPICLLGATNLNESVSLALRLPNEIPTCDGSRGLQQWLANYFLVFFFEWLGRGLDVDGDGECSLMDGYRYAGVRTNQAVRDLKVDLHIEADRLKLELQRLSSASAFGSAASPAEMLLVDATRQQLGQVLQMLYLHQDSWVMNSFLAPKIRFV